MSDAKSHGDDRDLLAVVQEALEQPDAERERFVVERCENDAALHRSVMSLLQRYAVAETAFESPLEKISLSLDPGSGSGAGWAAFLERLGAERSTWQRYVDHGEIARGGMGAIRRVFDPDLHRTLAMKVCLDGPTGASPSGSDASLGRFLEEAQVTAQLDHPGVVPVHEVGVDDEQRVFFTMKLVQGSTLTDVIKAVHDPEAEDWTLTRALSVIARVCETMAFAHAKGVIHRDLKPGNVMAGGFGEVYVMDWGLARILSRDGPGLLSTRRGVAGDDASPLLTQQGDVLGTPAYMPPEQASGRLEQMGPPADVYAVGAMLYHLVAGHPPYVDPDHSRSPYEILSAVQTGPPTPFHWSSARVTSRSS